MLTVLAICAVALSGCTRDTPTDFYWGYEPRSELEDWAAVEIDVAIDATGIGVDGWALRQDELSLFWDTDRELVLRNASTSPCHVDGNIGIRPRQLQFTIRHDGRPNAFAIAEYVRARWMSEGWVVKDIVRPEDMPEAEFPYIYIRADREGERAGLAFRANVNMLAIEIYSACSEDSSMLW